MHGIVTLRERKEARLAALRAGVAELEPVLAEYARANGGRFILFGSAARGDLRFHSDVDILVDFPADGDAAAVEFAVNACIERDLPSDVISFGYAGAPLRERVRSEGRVLS